MTSDQLRKALAELDGHRDLRVAFEQAQHCAIRNALLIPAEEDNVVKVTDGARVFLLDAQRIAWIVIGSDPTPEIRQ